MQKKFKIKKGDTVKVIAGAALGQQGVILDVDNVKQRVFIDLRVFYKGYPLGIH